LAEAFKVRALDDILAIEQSGIDAFLRAPTPFGLINASAERAADSIALRYLRSIDDPDSDLVLSYAELVSQIRQTANLFRRSGVGPTDAVAILAPHTAATQIALWAAQLAGRACPINPMLRPDHVSELIEASGAKVAVILGANRDMDVWSALVPHLRENGRLTHILDCDSDGSTAGSDGSLEDLRARESETLEFVVPDGSDALAAFFHTGGTTGAPKLALHARRNEAFVAQAAALMYDLGPDDVLINGFPLFHVAGAFVYGLSVLAAGGEILIPTRLGMRNRRFIETIWQQVKRYGVTVIGGVPTVMSALSVVPVNDDITTLRMMLTGGSPLPTELAEDFERRIGKPVRNILGMTECAGVVTIEPFHGLRTPGSTGLRLPFTDVRAFRRTSDGVDLSSPCEADEIGVIALRGPNVSPGYSDAGRNPGTFEPGGWLVSGDIGYVDNVGRVFVTGRAKDVIIRGAHNIDPALIEDALLQHPAVAVAAAVGQPDPYAGEMPVAYVTLKPGADVDANALRDFIVPLVAEPAAHPKRVTIVDAMPMTPIGKIFKPALRTLATRTAFEEALLGVGLRRDSFEISCGEEQTTVRLADPALAESARKALVGMPIRYLVT
jgi:fatty-acyl-CoA synthase